MKIALIYLAAGNSRRFGANKLLYPLDGRPMYRHLFDRLCHVAARHPQWVLVPVTQYEEIYDETVALGEKYRNLLPVFSPESQEGVSYSVRAGLNRVPDADAYAFFLADQPYLREETAEGFLLAMVGEALGSVVHEGERGNPVWFSAAYREELLSLTGDTGGRRILRAHPEAAAEYPVADGRELYDIDRLEVEGG